MTTEEENMRRYEAALHAMQSGVAVLISRDDGSHGEGLASQKHLRVGIDSAHVSDAALTSLLIEKGVFTSEEFSRALADEAEREAARTEKRVSDLLGRKVTLR